MPTTIKPMTLNGARMFRANPARARGDRAAGHSRSTDVRYWRCMRQRLRDHYLATDLAGQLHEAPMSLAEAAAMVEGELEPYSSDLDPLTSSYGEWEHIPCSRLA